MTTDEQIRELHRTIEAIKADALDVSNAQRNEIAQLRSQFAESDAARRHAQEVSSARVMEKRALEARVKELEARHHFGSCAKCLTNAWRICREDFPDAVEMKCSNGSTWWQCDYCSSKADLTNLRQLAGQFIEAWDHDGEPNAAAYEYVVAKARRALDVTPEVSKSVVKDSLTTEIATPSETIASVTAWANETFGQATVKAQMERAKKEWAELIDLFHPPDHTECCIPKKVAEEAADVCICLYRVIGTLDPEAINKKMAINRARKWNVDGQGCAQHVGE